MIRKGYISLGHLTGLTSGTIDYRKALRLLLWSLMPFVLWWTLKDVSVVEIIDQIRGIGFEAIVVLIGLNGIIFTLFSLRWWLILRTQGNPRSLLSLIKYRLAGFGITYFTPGPQFGGEPLQVYLLSQREGIKTSMAAASVAVDKILELLANFSFLLVGFTVILVGGSLKGAPRIELVLLPIFLLVLPSTYLVLLRGSHHPITSIFGFVRIHLIDSPRIEQLVNTVEEIEIQVSEFCQENAISLFMAAILSIGIWGLMVFEFSLMVSFLGARLNLMQILVALTAARLAFLLPLPAGMGTLEAGQVMAMGLIGINPVFGISLSLLIRLRDVVFGSIGLWLGGVYSR